MEGANKSNVIPQFTVAVGAALIALISFYILIVRTSIISPGFGKSRWIEEIERRHTMAYILDRCDLQELGNKIRFLEKDVSFALMADYLLNIGRDSTMRSKCILALKSIFLNPQKP